MELKVKQRIAIAVCFFLTGVCFSTWASRIPTIKDSFHLNEAQLGNLLMVMPITAIVGLPLSGWLVTRFNTRGPMLISFIIFAISLLGIGAYDSIWLLIISLTGFSFSLRLINIAMNTQAVTLQKKFTKKINGAFHGFWSLGGIFGLLISTLMIKFNVDITLHLGVVSIITIIVIIVLYPFLLKNDKPETGNKLILGKPDPFVLYLGLIVFFAAVCEGGIYDWNGVYFKEVVKVELFTAGYLSFMICMTLSRFYSDVIIDKIGIEKTFIASSLLIVVGIGLSIIFPYFWTALFGFCVTGFGIATLFPMAFTLAGESKKYGIGMTISIISTYSIIGMLIGPPLIGYIAFVFSLRTSFVIFIICGLMFIPISKLFFRIQGKRD